MAKGGNSQRIMGMSGEEIYIQSEAIGRRLSSIGEVGKAKGGDNEKNIHRKEPIEKISNIMQVKSIKKQNKKYS